MKYEIGLFRDVYDDNGQFMNKEHKTVVVEAYTCCDACILATKFDSDWAVSTWKCLEKTRQEEFVPETQYEKEAWAKVLKERESKRLMKEQEEKFEET